MKRRALSVLAWLLSTAMVVVALWYGRKIPFVEQWPLYEALRTTAAIIFAVVGAWLAIVYPDRLRLSFDSESKKAEAGSRFRALFTPVVNSTIVLCVVLMVGIAAPVMRQLQWVVSNASAARALSFSLLTGLTLWQMWTVVLTLVPADVLKSAADREASKQISMNALRGLGASVPKPEGDDAGA